jgi:hypothetical protein
VIAVMYFGAPQREHGGEGGWGAQVAMCVAALAVLLVGFFPSAIATAANQADKSLARPAPAMQSAANAMTSR